MMIRLVLCLVVGVVFAFSLQEISESPFSWLIKLALAVVALAILAGLVIFISALTTPPR